MNLTSLNLFVLGLLQEGGAAEGAAEGAAAEPMSPLLPLLMVGAIFWFILIAPERKKRKAREAQMSSLKKGDRIMTTTGMYATIAQIQDEVVTLQIADGVRVKFALAAIQGPADENAPKDKAGDKSAKKDKKDDKSEKDSKDSKDSKSDDAAEELVSSSK